MKRHVLETVVLLTSIACGAVAWGANRLDVESKTVNKGQAGVTIGIKVTNDVDLNSLVVPLILRSITPGAFVTAMKLTYGERLPLTGGSPIVEIKVRNQYADENGTCKGGNPGGFFTIAFSDSNSHPVAASPEGALFVRAKLTDSTLHPGADVTGSLGLTVTVTNSQGSFEIDTTCTNPANHLAFSNDANNEIIIPDFTKGVISIGHPPVARDTSWSTPEDVPRSPSYLPASDPDLDPLTFSISTGPQHGGISGFNPVTGGFTYTPASDYSGPDSVKFQATDGGYTSNIGTVRITVTPVNDAPVARDTAVTTSQETPVNALFQAFDPEGDPLTFTKLTGPFHGTFTGFDAATGAFTYTPSAAFLGQDSITFRAKDATLNSNTATVRITVSWINHAPVARDTSISMRKNESAAGKFQSYDVDGQPLTYMKLTGPFNGAFTGFDSTTGVFTYTPGLDFLGRDSITFQSRDSALTSNIGTVRILVTEGACSCTHEGDPNLDGKPDVRDVIHEINVVFQGGPYLIIRPCSRPYEEMNCDCFINVFDVLYLIRYVFQNGPPPCSLCESPCH